MFYSDADLSFESFQMPCVTHLDVQAKSTHGWSPVHEMAVFLSLRNKEAETFFFVVVNQRKENSKEGRISVNFVGCLKMTVLHITHLYVVFLVLYCNVKVIYDAIWYWLSVREWMI